MNELVTLLNENRGLLEEGLGQVEAPNLAWLAQKFDREWIVGQLELTPFQGLLAASRLPALDSSVWDSHGIEARDGSPGEGAWVVFLKHERRGLMLPDDSGEKCWSTFLPQNNRWVPVRLLFDMAYRLLRRVEFENNPCAIDQAGRCDTIHCLGLCKMVDYMHPFVCRKCMCQPLSADWPSITPLRSRMQPHNNVLEGAVR